MLVIVGMILLLTWIFDHAIHLTPSSLVNLLLLFASISLVLDFLRERGNLQDPRPGWDAMPRRGWIAESMRRVRHKMDGGSSRAGRTDAVDRVAGVSSGAAARQTRAA